MNKEKDLIIENRGLDGLNFKINNENVLISDINALETVNEVIYRYCEHYYKISDYLIIIESIETNIDDFLASCVKEKDGKIFYDLGMDFAYMFNEYNEKINAFDNKLIVDKLLKIIDDKFGKSCNLFLEAETNFCHVYTRDKLIAKNFINFCVNDYLIPYLNVKK